jgi:microcystin-dependent protein
MTLYKWSQTASADATADSTINWAEGMAPSAVNDSGRAMMAATAKYRDDIAGAIVTGGSATAYTVTSFQVFDTLAHLNGQMIAFTPNATNTNTVGNDVTLNVDGLGAKPIRMAPSVALPNGTLVLGTPYIVIYNNSDAVFYLKNMTNPYNIPLGAGMDFWGSTAPNTSFAFPTGQAISRTTYATLFAIMSTTYGTGDGSTTFNLPDKTGRVSAMKEASATRLTSTYFVGNSTNLGAVGGLESNNVILTHTHVNSLTDPGHVHSFNSGNSTAGGGSYPGSSNSSSFTANTSGSVAIATTGITITNASAGTASAHNLVQPTIVCNYIIRII